MTDIIPLDNYKLNVNDVIVSVDIFRNTDGFSFYYIAIKNLSPTTNVILQKIRDEFVSKINVGEITIGDDEDPDKIKERFRNEILVLIKKYFPNTDKKTADLLMNQILRQNIGLGDIEILLRDENLEEIAINNAKEPIWVYHKRHGWLKTNIRMPSDERIRHYATMIGRDVGKEITLLKPLLDAHLMSGDRVNATLNPVSTKGNTITIRKFATKPWTITDFLADGTISYEAAALIWLCVHNELSILISGGTGSGKTSMLNVVASFIPINQRIVSIEDTREITLPRDLHWVPMEIRLPNPEGKGEISMLDLLVNSLRMRPDRIIMGEVRRKREAEVMFEAMHTGHSVYGTIHANDVEETVQRLINPPIEVPRAVLPALNLLVIQNRNRRTGRRRTIQVAEILPNGQPNLLMQYNASKDKLEQIGKPIVVVNHLKLYTGMDERQIEVDLAERENILRWLVKSNINDIHQVGTVFRKYYAKKFIR
ncbi:MAG: ATPase, T2SS/T4P/T4SS family [Nanoarchaeota archaeon]